MTPTIAPTGATLDADELESFLRMYADACAAAGRRGAGVGEGAFEVEFRRH